MTLAEEREVIIAGKAEPAAPAKEKAGARFVYLDWLRGAAAVIMMQGHTFHSFAGDRHGSWYILSQFFGGMAPACFLFLTGITYALGMERNERQSLSNWRKIRAALGRARYLFVLAILFRLQVWVSGWPGSPTRDLFKVDILNCMGFGMAMLALFAVMKSAERSRFAALAGLGIAAVSPLISMIAWDRVPWMIRLYLEPNSSFFSFFPWASFLAFGIAAGSIISRVPKQDTGRMLQWAAVGGLALVVAAQYFSNLPYSLYSKSEFWLNSPGLPLIKLGVVMVWAALAFVWTQYGSSANWSWVRQLGTSSLLVYWVHIELVYGRWLGAWKASLPDWACATLAACLISSMVLLAWTKERVEPVLRARFRSAA